jgi:hypothetical protein
MAPAAEILPGLRRVNAMQPNLDLALVRRQDGDRVAVGDADDAGGEIRRPPGSRRA